ncbi:thiamine diphosphokinase [Aminipila luticellarii]|uniref:Thiamine diphosphokinase n=1 Tax=Aminipila luticellarii TaxID=2507160 RepID=A0A410PW38_9FIRM|nr:thiamine diphosphokinase [Aminipila luticellarii]QAT43110.1 thiamine diphosphokinase [Aminipila luticellarii]
MNKCFIITGFINGNIKNIAHISKEDYIICADGGYRFAIREGIEPDLLIGDFDSFTEGPPDHVHTITHPIEKDDTDTMLCIKYAVEKGIHEICLIGGMGGRLDHTLSNLQSMAWATEFWHSRHMKGRTIRMLDCQNEVMMLKNDTLQLSGTPGEKISLISYSDACMNVTAKSLKWKLINAHLTNSFPLGISNEFLTDQCEISVGNGCLLILRSKDLG